MKEKFKLPVNLVEQVSKEGMSKVLGGGNLWRILSKET